MSTQRRVASLLSVPARRLDALSALRTKILGPLATKQPVLESKATQLMDWHPADIDVHKLAKQDASLTHLGLTNVRYEVLKARELAAKARGKHIRISSK
jgi:hypothetical protein